MKILLTHDFSNAMEKQPKDVISNFIAATDKLQEYSKHQLLRLDSVVDISSPEDKVKLYAYNVSEKRYAVFTFTPKNEMLILDYIELVGGKIVSVTFP